MHSVAFHFSNSLLHALPVLFGGWQIGPKIRVGGTLGKIGQDLKIGAGKVLSNKIVDTGLSLIPGVGPGMAAAANATGHVLDTSNGGIHSLGDVAGVAKDAGETYGLSKFANMLKTKIPGIGGGGAGGAAGSVAQAGSAGAAGAGAAGGGSSIPGLGGVQEMLDKAGGFSGIAGKVGDFLGGNGGMNALGVAEGVNQALLQKKSDDYAKNALGTAQASYDARAPLRTAGIAGMLNPSAGIAPKIAALPQGPNPYAQTPGVQGVR